MFTDSPHIHLRGGQGLARQRPCARWSGSSVLISSSHSVHSLQAEWGRSAGRKNAWGLKVWVCGSVLARLQWGCPCSLPPCIPHRPSSTLSSAPTSPLSLPFFLFLLCSPRFFFFLFPTPISFSLPSLNAGESRDRRVEFAAGSFCSVPSSLCLGSRTHSLWP